jgi:hypothetical protein
MIIITPHLQELGWLPVKNHLRYRDLLIMFNCLNDMALGYLSTKFSTRSSIHDRETRNMNDLDVPIFKANSAWAEDFQIPCNKVTERPRL